MDGSDRRNALRECATDAEARLWCHLRARRLEGWKFRRQYPVGPFVVDFACVEAALVVEVDGSQHQERADADHSRTRYLETHGFRVIRFWNHDVLEDTDTVLEEILRHLYPWPRPRRPPRRG